MNTEADYTIGKTTMNNDIPEMLTIHEASQRTKLSYYCIKNLCLNQKVIFIKSGTKYLINFNSLIDYLNSAGA